MSDREPSGPKGMPQKAMLLAAGLGTRLRPLTDTVPKCMILIAGKPLLEHNVDTLRKYGVCDIVINLHHLPQAIVNHFGDGSRLGIRITYSVEPELLGTAGAVKKAEQFFDGPFFVWYGDNMSTCRLDRMWQFHQSSRSAATIALHYREDPTQSGIVELDDNDRVTRFLEKPRPDQFFSRWVNAGILALERDVLESIPASGFSDFGRDIFPALLERDSAIFGYRMEEDENLWWIDAPEDLATVEQSLGVQPGQVSAE